MRLIPISILVFSPAKIKVDNSNLCMTSNIDCRCTHLDKRRVCEVLFSHVTRPMPLLNGYFFTFPIIFIYIFALVGF